MTERGETPGGEAFEREKWKTDLSFREREVIIQERETAVKEADQRLRVAELQLKEDELALKKQEQHAANWRNPLVVAIFAAAIAAGGNAYIAYRNGRDQVNLEELKAEQTRILEMIKTGDPESASNNLKFLLDTGLISDERAGRYKQYLAERPAESGPVLPAPFVVNPSSRGPPEGLSDDPAVRARNVLKNREAAPSQSDIDKHVTLAALLAPGPDETRFDETKAATIVGVVTDVKMSGRTSANFKSARAADRDVTIRLAATRDAARNQQVFVILTPRFREQMEARQVDWSLPALRSLVGKKVQVSGWLLFNGPHKRWAENTNPGGTNNFRATAWELHPVTEIKLLDNAASSDLRIPK
jgi:hypothetical protein